MSDALQASGFGLGGQPALLEGTAWFERLLESGAKLRQAQAAGLAGKPVNVHDPLKARREALNELSRQAGCFCRGTVTRQARTCCVA